MQIFAKQTNTIKVEGLTKDGVDVVKNMLYGILDIINKNGSYTIKAIGAKESYISELRFV